MNARSRLATRAILAAAATLACLTISVGCASFLWPWSAADGTGGLGDGLTDGGEMTVLIQRSEDNRMARVVYYTPGPHGGVFGTAIQLFIDDELQFESFERFIESVLLGNAYFLGARAPETATDVYADETMQTIADPGSLGQEADSEYTRSNIRCEVVENQAPVLYGYHVDIYVDDAYIISIYKSCNECDLFSLAEAESVAGTCVYLLQGWTR